jgi:hypothetical protein
MPLFEWEELYERPRRLLNLRVLDNQGFQDTFPCHQSKLGSGKNTMRSARSWIIIGCRRSLPLLAALALAWLGADALADVVTFAPAGEHLSVQLPANANQKDTEADGTKVRQWTASDNGFFYLVQHAVHRGAVFAPSQMQTNLHDFISNTKCTVSTQQTATVPGPGRAAAGVALFF